MRLHTCGLMAITFLTSAPAAEAGAEDCLPRPTSAVAVAAHASAMAASSLLPTITSVHVGINDYASEGQHDLTGAEPDALAFADIFGAGTERVLVGPRAKRIDILAAIGAASHDRADLSVISLAGHGTLVDETGQKCVTGQNARCSEECQWVFQTQDTGRVLGGFSDRETGEHPTDITTVNEAITATDLARAIGSTRPTVIIADTCYAEALARALEGNKNITVLSGTEYYSEGGDLAVADDAIRGVFSFFVDAGLRTGDADGWPLGKPDGIITAAELQAFAAEYANDFYQEAYDANRKAHPPFGGSLMRVPTTLIGPNRPIIETP